MRVGRAPLGVRVVTVTGLIGAAWALLVGLLWLWTAAESGRTVSLALAAGTCLSSCSLLVGLAGVLKLRSWAYVLTVVTVVPWLLTFAVVPYVTGVAFAVLATLESAASVVALLAWAPSLVAVVVEVAVLLYLPLRRSAFFARAGASERGADDRRGRYQRGLR